MARGVRYTLRAIESRAIRELQSGSERRKTVVDTMTYASVAVLPWNIAQDRSHLVLLDVEFIRLNVSMIKR